MNKMEGHFRLRVPSDLKLWIAAQAKQYGSSQNSEILRCIRERMDRQAQTKAAQ